MILPKSIIGKPELYDFYWFLINLSNYQNHHPLVTNPEVKNHPMPWLFLHRSSSPGAPIDTNNVVPWCKNGDVREPQNQIKKPSDLSRTFGHPVFSLTIFAFLWPRPLRQRATHQESWKSQVWERLDVYCIPYESRAKQIPVAIGVNKSVE